MRRFLFLSIVLAISGCTANGDKGPFSEAIKDLRGDNMRMRSGVGGSGAFDGGEMPRLNESNK